MVVSGNDTIATNGQLQLSGGISVSNNMTLSGQGYNGYTGALRSTNGTNTVTGNIDSSFANTRIASDAGSLSLSGTINLSAASFYNNTFQSSGGDIRLSGNITGSATGFTVLSTTGTNFFITDRANAWNSTTTLGMGVGGTNYARISRRTSSRIAAAPWPR
ncbi:MAG: hypothetical protein EBY26_02150 [Microbacteriaceae bacterium]|nr:hypothetical protein [Microbacteriaceae bacterium]